MEQAKLTKQMIEFQKTTFDNSFNALTILQEQAEKMVNLILEQSPWFPKEGKDAVGQWVKSYKNGREAYKTSVDESYKKVEEFIQGADKGAKSKSGK